MFIFVKSYILCIGQKCIPICSFGLIQLFSARSSNALPLGCSKLHALSLYNKTLALTKVIIYNHLLMWNFFHLVFTKIKAGARELLQYYSKSYDPLRGILYLLLVECLQPRVLVLRKELHRAVCVLNGVVYALLIARMRADVYARNEYFKQL